MLKIEEYQHYSERLRRYFPAYRLYYQDVIRGKPVTSVELLIGSEFKVPKSLWAPVGMRTHTILAGQRVLFAPPPEVEKAAQALAAKIRQARELTKSGRPLPEPKFSISDKGISKTRLHLPDNSRPVEAGAAFMAYAAVMRSGLGSAIEENFHPLFPTSRLSNLLDAAELLVADRLVKPKTLAKCASGLKPYASALVEIRGVRFRGDVFKLISQSAELLWLGREVFWPILPEPRAGAPKIIRAWRPGSPLLNEAAKAAMAVSIDDSGRLLRLAPLPANISASALLETWRELDASKGDYLILDDGAPPELCQELATKPGLIPVLAGRSKGRAGKLASWKIASGGLRWLPLPPKGPGQSLKVEGFWIEPPEDAHKKRHLNFWGNGGFNRPEDLWKVVQASLRAERTLLQTDLKKPSPEENSCHVAMAGFLAARLIDYIRDRLEAADLPGSWTSLKAMLSDQYFYTDGGGRRRATSLPEAGPYFAALEMPELPISNWSGRPMGISRGKRKKGEG